VKTTYCFFISHYVKIGLHIHL